MLTFTDATEADIPVLRDLAHQIWHAHYPSIITVEQIDYMLARFFAADVIRQELARGSRWVIASIDQQPAGFLCWLLEPGSPRIKLSKIYLQPRWHGRGLGREMINHVKSAARQAGARQIHLTVNKQNVKALRAYERAGFHIVRPVVAKIGSGFVMDDYEMAFDVG